MCILCLLDDVGHSGQLCLAFCEKNVCPSCSDIVLKLEDFGGPAARTDTLNGTFFCV